MFDLNLIRKKEVFFEDNLRKGRIYFLLNKIKVSRNQDNYLF